MLLWLLDRLAIAWPALLDGTSREVLQKASPRTALSACLSFTLALLLGPRLIRWLRARFQDPIQSPSRDIRLLHQGKRFTPTMGGLFIVAGLVGGLLAFADLGNPFARLAIVLALGMAGVGALDDWHKLHGSANGISARHKLLGQTLVALVVSAWLYTCQRESHDGLLLWVPWLGRFSLGAWSIPWAMLVIVASSNAVNLADGLDGLASGCMLLATGALGAVVYASGHAGLAEYLHLPHVAGSSEMLVVAGAIVGSVLGFLWFNCHPAQVFMGDTGSLALGAILGYLALVARQEFLLVTVAFVFVVEACSVLLQLAWRRLLGRRLFRCAPLHHHFELLGWPETKIVVRFWIAGALCAVLGLSTLWLGAGRAGTRPTHRAARHSMDWRESVSR